jgi:membrane-bound lytic murein transglycosylase D
MASDMDDDKTVLKPRSADQQGANSDRTILFQPETLSVSLLGVHGEIVAKFSFSQSFTAGRGLDNSIVIDNSGVSRHHLEVKHQDGSWWIYNLRSANGVYINNNLIEDKERLTFPVLVSLGRSGIFLEISKNPHRETRPRKNAQKEIAERADIAASGPEIKTYRSLAPEDIKARFLAEEEAKDSGEYTRIVRRLIHEDRTVRRKSYKKAIWLLSIFFGLSISLVGYQHIVLTNTRKLALQMFYDIKTLEVSLSQADIKLEESADALDKTMIAIASEKLRSVEDQLRAEKEKVAAERRRMSQERLRLASMKGQYREYVKEANSLRLRFPTEKQYEEELIAKVASEFGESELELPEGFVAEVRKYIKYWQSSSRLQKAMDNVEKNDYLPIVKGALEKHGLPLHFVYLPLQESDYDTLAIGPQTRFGIAKGAWQLLATTAQDYGVSPGPLANVATYDAQDARFDFRQSTQAGAKYLKRIYSTEAQASGLLVMASYNYGDNRVRRMIKQMPDNPRERNFWKFIQQYELPKETRDYVFQILSAAVIGEDPQHFGFKFVPPLLKAGADGTRKDTAARQTNVVP